MGRGLSDMQQAALRMAYENKQAGKRYTSGGHELPQVALWEFLAQWYKWPVNRSVYVQQRFNSSAIGEGEYKAGKAAASRAISRLVERGLVRRTRAIIATSSGYELTEEGERIARELNG